MTRTWTQAELDKAIVRMKKNENRMKRYAMQRSNALFVMKKTLVRGPSSKAVRFAPTRDFVEEMFRQGGGDVR